MITYDDGINIFLNGEEIEVRHMPAAHTDGDSVVFFATSKVVHMGDVFVRYGFPFIDVNGGGSVQGMIAACDKAHRRISAGREGDSRPRRARDAGRPPRATIKMLKDTTAAVQKALARPQDAGADERRQDPCAVAEVLGEFRQYRCVYRDDLQLADG